MNRTLLVIKREYLSRVKKKSFVIMTILGPILLALLWGAAIYFSTNQEIGSRTTRVYIVDGTNYFQGKFKDDKNIVFINGGQHFDSSQARALLDSGIADGVLHIPDTLNNNKPAGIEYISEQSPSLHVKGYIQNSISERIEESKLQALGIKKADIDSLKTDVSILTRKPNNEINATEAATGAGFAGAFLIYLFIFLYGAMVMRGVLEEKMNRIVEVVISSVRPMQLMMGKIIGIALVGLTQFLIWVAFSGILITTVSAAMGAETKESPGATALVGQVLALPWGTILGMFVFYFVSGYLFYSALFAAVGSAVDSETETQQFMLPVTIPLIFALIMAQSAVIQNPHGPLAMWLSMIPFTSPVVMMVRLPFDVPAYELILSAVFMIAGFIFTTWIAARIYRTGILMYGKKATYKELFKWIFYRG